MATQTRQTTKQDGSVLLSLILVIPFLVLTLAAYMELTASSLRLARVDHLHTHAQLAVDAGIDVAMTEINAPSSTWIGTGGQVDLHNAGGIRTSYEVTVNTSGSDKEVVSTGRSFSPAASTTASTTITIRVNLREVSSGNFSIVTGVGGLYMSNSSKILGGDVFVNGEVSMSNSAQIGLSTNPVNLSVAHQICPIPATSSYPELCGAGNGEPISLTNQAHIYGDVKANNQTTSTGMSDPGLTASSGVAPQPLPPHDRAAQIAAVTTNVTGSDASCSSGTKTWAANTKITGDVEIKNTCDVTVMGDIWITGKLTAENSASMKVDDSLGVTRPNIVIDGSSGALFKNSFRLISNTSGTGFQILTYYSNSTCSPDCPSVTGTDLYDSRNAVTIKLDNNASGPNTIFYARWSRVEVANSGQIGALVGQTIELKNSGTITFGTSVGTGTSFWVIDGYRRTFN